MESSNLLRRYGCYAIARYVTVYYNLNKIWNTYNSVTIALDKDATDKAINMSRRIFVGVDKCKVVALEFDIKDMAIEDIQKCLS